MNRYILKYRSREWDEFLHMDTISEDCLELFQKELLDEKHYRLEDYEKDMEHPCFPH